MTTSEPARERSRDKTSNTAGVENRVARREMISSCVGSLRYRLEPVRSTSDSANHHSAALMPRNLDQLELAEHVSAAIPDAGGMPVGVDTIVDAAHISSWSSAVTRP